MPLARLVSRGQRGLDAYEVTVEVHVASGLPTFTVTGLPAAAVRESKDRVRAALATAGLAVPNGRITVHLGPADVPKEGGRFDLAIAIGLVMAQRHERWAEERIELVGELSLSGELRPITGALPAVLAARDAGRSIVVPAGNANEAALVADAEAYGAATLGEALAHVDGDEKLVRVAPRPITAPSEDGPDFADVRGQALAKRALVIAAAGGHNALMIGPPGSGKSMLAERFRGLLPPLDLEDMMLVASIASVAGDRTVLENGLRPPFRAPHHTSSAAALVGGGSRPRPGAVLPPSALEDTMLVASSASVAGDRTVLGNGLGPPFRAPHHTSSAAALVGGGSRPRPGEISLAHRGVLFLDELPEFSRTALEA